MKKIIIAFSFIVFAFTTSSASNIKKPLNIKNIEKKENRQIKVKKLQADVCTKCIWWPGGGACGTAETCWEAVICLYLALE